MGSCQSKRSSSLVDISSLIDKQKLKRMVLGINILGNVAVKIALQISGKCHLGLKIFQFSGKRHQLSVKILTNSGGICLIFKVVFFVPASWFQNSVLVILEFSWRVMQRLKLFGCLLSVWRIIGHFFILLYLGKSFL